MPLAAWTMQQERKGLSNQAAVGRIEQAFYESFWGICAFIDEGNACSGGFTHCEGKRHATLAHAQSPCCSDSSADRLEQRDMCAM